MRGLLAFLALGLTLWMASPAAAQLEPCLEDPVACVGDTVVEVTGTVEEVVGDTGDEVGETIGGIVGGGAGEPAPETADPQQRTNPGSGASPRGSGGATAPGGGGGTPEPASTARPGTAARSVEPRGAVRPEPPVADPGRTAERTLSGSTPALAFPLALMVMVGAFLLVQTRLDRSDPKLALAPVEAGEEILTFA